MLRRCDRSLFQIRVSRHPHSLFAMALQEKEARVSHEEPDVVPVVIFALKACSSLRDLETGTIIHAHAIESSHDSCSIRVASSLINMYAKCGSMALARAVFDAMPTIRDVVSWTTMIAGYAENGEIDLAFTLFSTMQQEGCAPNERTFTAVLKACAGLASRERGRELHGKIWKVKSLERGRALHLQAASTGFEGDAFVCSSVVEMYAKCGSLVDAKAVFDRMSSPDIVAWTVLMLGYVENEEEDLALELLASMKENARCAPNARTLSVAVKACTSLALKEEGQVVAGTKLVKLASLEKGMSVHSEAVKTGWISESFLATSLVDMYGKCGTLLDARMIFDKMDSSNVVSWNSLILGYVENDEEDLALAVFKSMDGFCELDSRTFVAATKACSNLAAKEQARKLDGKLVKVRSLEKGREVHGLAGSCDRDAFLGSALVEMYSQCGSLVDAWRAYGEMSYPDVVAWTTLILAYAENGEESRALEVFEFMKPEGCEPDSGVFIAAIRACGRLAENCLPGSKLKALEKTMMVHSQALRYSLDLSIFFDNTLVDTYAKCGSLEDSRRAFDRMSSHSVVSWTVLMAGCVENGNEELALELFSVMGVEPDAQSYVAALNACIALAVGEPGKHVDDGKAVKLRALDRGMAIHSQAAAGCWEADFFVSSTLVELYARCGNMLDARMVFDRMPCHDLVSWNTLILGYAENGEEEFALKLYLELQENEELYSADAQTFAAALKACSNQVDLETGRRLHREICRAGDENDEVLAACLVDLYGKCGSTINSRLVFDSTPGEDMVSWNALLASYARQGDSDEVLGLFHRMQDEALGADGITFVSVLTACSHAGLVERGTRYFEEMMSKYGVKPDIDHYHCVVDLLGRANRLDEAVAMVRRMPFEPSSLTWRTVLGACGKWKNSSIGQLAFESLLELGDDRDVAAAYLLMVKAR
ncbi:pentatricopeptide repeat-containing protein At4g39530-like isoform X1 [Selaginella moellendorffii]|uniref:pentatricopeptide repeat-containing protein At4g39530-like isoform X1 n=1 Tax=Selaginella moellendorffii TaxID=88036 RepID=UPI000D1C6ABA|nr:pentatricopeptide repeat-containing protein At4g39530-like isoform X1 [Selaginella moellendorffii]|eukprot:XP_024521066.1 pentatricopeptide repeat-containing protein At4g39530-like isoform X1 [Selaginella moellendorffii]